jgi:hypothetical protein
MNTRVNVGALICLLFLAAAPTPADACSCMASGPPCQAFWAADAVFTARVTAIEPLSEPREALSERPSDSWPTTSRRVTLSILEAFRGVTGRTVAVYTGAGGGDCGYLFKVGGTYVVYAKRWPRSAASTSPAPGRLYANICSRTAPLEQAAEDLTYAHDVRAGTVPAGTISGVVRRVAAYMAPDANAKPQPVPDIHVRLFGPGPVREAVTDRSGRFEFGSLAVGDYTIIPVAPPGLRFEISRSDMSVSIKDPRQCATMDLTLVASR